MNDLHHRPLAVAVSLCLLLAVPALAGAQETPRTTTELDRVEVTGSRIKRAEVEGQVPIQTLTRAELERTGMNSIGEVLQQLTGSGSALNAKFNSSGNFGFPPDGSGVGAAGAGVLFVLAAWIADPQTLKPGNNMPMVPLNAEELRSISAYLAGLK